MKTQTSQPVKSVDLSKNFHYKNVGQVFNLGSFERTLPVDSQRSVLSIEIQDSSSKTIGQTSVEIGQFLNLEQTTQL